MSGLPEDFSALDDFNWSAFFTNIGNTIANALLKLVYALIILVIGILLIKLLIFIMNKILTKRKWDPTLAGWVSSVISGILKVILLTIVISALGMEIVSLAALIAAVGLAVGSALGGILQNFVAGAIIMATEPIKVDEWVSVDGNSGVVKLIKLTCTHIITFNQELLIVPNTSFVTSVVTNYSRLSTRRLDMIIGIGYSDDIQLARKVTLETLLSCEKVLKDPAPQVQIQELAASSVNLLITPWIATPSPAAQFKDTIYELQELIFEAFKKNNVNIPFPQVDCNFYSRLPVIPSNSTTPATTITTANSQPLASITPLLFPSLSPLLPSGNNGNNVVRHRSSKKQHKTPLSSTSTTPTQPIETIPHVDNDGATQQQQQQNLIELMPLSPNQAQTPNSKTESV